MMRTIALFSLLSVAVFSCTGSKHPTEHPQQEQVGTIQWEARRDTVLQETAYGSVYITYDTSARFYDWLVPSDIAAMDEDYRNYYEEMLQSVRDTHNVQVRHFPTGDFPLGWVPLHSYRRNFYVYGPSDWMFHTSMLLSDSVVYTIETDLDNAASVIRDVRQLSPTEMKLSLFDRDGAYFLYIRIVDAERGIAIWERTDADNRLTGRSLYVDAAKVKRFPMIICDCGDQKCFFSWNEFDKPDWNLLLENAR